MQFEILNTIKFVVYVLVMAIIYWQLKKREIVKSGWLPFWLIMAALTAMTYTQFFTLTEKEDNRVTRHVMLQQGAVVRNQSDVTDYVQSVTTETVQPTKSETQALLLLEQEKSKLLAYEIENKGIK